MSFLLCVCVLCLWFVKIDGTNTVFLFVCLLYFVFVFVYCKAGTGCEEDWLDDHIAQKHRRNSLFMPSLKIIWGWSKLSEFSTSLTNGFADPTQNRGTVVQQIGHKLRSLWKEKQICHLLFVNTDGALDFGGASTFCNTSDFLHHTDDPRKNILFPWLKLDRSQSLFYFAP